MALIPGRGRRALAPTAPYASRLLIQRLAAVATGAMLGVACGLPLAFGNVRPLILAPVLCLGLVGLASLLAPRESRRTLQAGVLLALVMRLAVAVVLYHGSVESGRGGFITGDDRSYATLSWAFAEYLHGRPIEPYVPPSWGTESYLFGTYVYLESAIFYVFGNDVLLMTFLNGAALSIAALLLYDLTRRIFSERAGFAAATIVAFYPSLVLWSALNLKDAVALLFITALLWLIHRLQVDPRLRIVLALVVLLFLMQSLRRYIFILLAVIAPLGVIFGLGRFDGRRLRAAVFASVSCLLLLANDFSGASWLGPSLESFENVRQAMGFGARTRYTEPTPIQVKPGDAFVVVAPGQTAPPAGSSGSAKTVQVPANTRLIVVPAGEALPPPAEGVAYVRHGEVVRIQGGEGPVGSIRPLSVPEAGPSGPDGPTVRVSGDDVVRRTIAHIPVGLAYALFAPFPWDLERDIDRLTIPEMLVWYALLPLAAVTVWRSRHRWRLLLPVVLFVGGVVAVFTLAEGNFGTLYRHRSMVIPFVTMLAAPTLLDAWSRLRHRSRLAKA